MHRVELKDFWAILFFTSGIVPNAPCGVERREVQSLALDFYKGVPNAPCGVERLLVRLFHLQTKWGS